MTAGTTRPADQMTPAVPDQGRRQTVQSPTDRVVRQVRGIDAWIAARRRREQALQAASMNRDERLDAAREVEALRRTHDAIRGRCARSLDAEAEPMRWPEPTAVIAHRHAWFFDKLALLLDERGVTVLLRTDNGAEALGAVVAEQPDLILVGDRLAMMPGLGLLAEARRYAPSARLAAQASDPDQADALRGAADSVFLRHHPPAFIADALVALHLTRPATPAEPEQPLRNAT